MALGVAVALPVGRGVVVPVGLMLNVDDSDAVAVGSALSETDAVIASVKEWLAVGVPVDRSVSFVMLYVAGNDTHAVPISVRSMA